MTNVYRAVSKRAQAMHGEEPFEAEFTAAEEHDELSAGHLEIEPRDYDVLSNNFSAGKQGDVVSLALPVEQEAALIQGGHIKRAAPKAKSTTKKKG